MVENKAFDPLEIREPKRWLIVVQAILFAAIAVTVGLSAAWAYNYQRDMVARKAMDTLATTAFFETQALRQWSKTSRLSMTNVVSIQELQHYLKGKGAFPMKAFLKSLEEQGFFAGCLADQQGFPIDGTWAGNPQTFPAAYSKQPATANSQAPSWRILTTGSPQTSIECCMPLPRSIAAGSRSAKSPTFLVALSTCKPLLSLQIYLASHQSEELFLCQKEADAVNYFSPAKEMRLIKSEPFRSESAAGLAISGETIQGEMVGDYGEMHLYATSYEAYTRWGLVLSAEEADVLNPMRMTFALLWSLVLALMLLLTGAFVFIWRQRYVKTVREANQMLQDMLQRILETQERERVAVSRDLHDGMCQYLDAAQSFMTRLRMDTEGSLPERAAKALDRANECVKDAARISRATVGMLRPEVLEGLGVAAALEDMQYSWAAPPELELDVAGDPKVKRLPIESEEHLYRIAQEALQNAKKHAIAKKITLRFHQSITGTLLEIIDDGKGIGQAANVHKHGFGISVIKERARILGAALQITSNVRGTHIRVELPAKVLH